jgi:V/A-type H+-transporting ATPase subunit B
MRADLSVTGAATRIEGPLLFLRRTLNVGLNEAVEVIGADCRARLGRISALDEEFMVIEVLESTQGLSPSTVRVRFFGEPLHFALGPGVFGRIFNGVGQVIDGGPPVAADRRLRIEGLAINPAARADPRDFIETGISTIDLMNSLVRGQKLPIFSGGGLPHDRMAIEIAQNAHLRGHTVMFLNLASDSSVQRLLTPRFALTAAEYLAFFVGKHVLVVMTDMTNYSEALREVSASHSEVPSRKGYPGYMYSDLASIYERAGCITDMPGTLTQLPILTMPADDISHPIPDLTGYITEGQIVLDRDLDRRGIYPPVRVLPSLSRLMKDGTGEGYTHGDHPALASQLYAAYARAVQVRVLASVVGVEGLPDVDRKYLAFGDLFEDKLVQQEGVRALEQSMQAGWELLKALPVSELSRLSDEQIDKYLGEA